VRGFLLYAAACVIAVALIGVVAWALLDEGGRRAVLLSAGLAVAVQLVTYGVARRLVRRNMLLGWGLGSVLRLLVLVIYAVLVVQVWRVPVAPALLSFVGFLFVTTVFEPIFLKQ
jgi:hypothetical protein